MNRFGVHGGLPGMDSLTRGTVLLLGFLVHQKVAGGHSDFACGLEAS